MQTVLVTNVTQYAGDEKSTVTQQLIGALSQANVGMVLARTMSIQEDMLVIRLETTAANGTPVARTLTWKRLGDAG